MARRRRYLDEPAHLTANNNLERFFGIATPEVTDNNIYQSRIGMLPEVSVTAKGDPRKVNNDYYKAHSRARANLQSRVADRADYAGLNPMNLFEYAPIVGDALDAARIANDAFNKNYLGVGIGAGMFLLPNIVEKPLKKIVKPVVKDISKWTPEQWTAAQDAAITRGDIDEAQRLRDLHMMAKGNNNSLIEGSKPLDLYHNTDNIFTSFDIKRAGRHDEGYFGKGIYVSPMTPQYRYGNNTMHLYANVENPLILENYASDAAKDAENFYNRGYHSFLEKWQQELSKVKEAKALDDLKLSRNPDNPVLQKIALNRKNNYQAILRHSLKKDPENRYLQNLLDMDDIRIPLKYLELKNRINEIGWKKATKQVNLDNHDAVIPFRPDIYEKSSSPKDAIEIVIKDGKQIKSADAVTYDDSGVRIPLGERDNFNINDIRYGLLPFVLGGYGAYRASNNETYANGGTIHIKPKNRGKLDIPPYTQFLNTLPDNLKNSGDEYNMRRYWELNGHPKDFNEGIQKGMFTKQDDGYHANSVAFNHITNSYEFMKDRNHPTYNMELDWYYSDNPEAVEFRKNYKYTPGIGMIPDQYTPIFKDGGSIHIKPENRGKFTALKERTGHSATWFKNNGTPAQKKMAVFALNSRKWKH